jgi:hypothetical protein
LCTYSQRELTSLVDDSDIPRLPVQHDINIISSEYSILSFPTFRPVEVPGILSIALNIIF